MNKIKQAMEAGVEEFVKEYSAELGFEDGFSTTVQPRYIEEYVDWLKSHQHTLIDAVVEEVWSHLGMNGGLRSKDEALQDIVELLQDAKE